MVMPAWANDHWTRPEQSNEPGPVAPHTYGRPFLLSAARSASVSWDALTPPRPSAALGAVPTGDVRPDRVTSVTRASTPAPLGRTALILAVSEATLDGGALTTMAFPAGTPSDLATVSDITASSPTRPTWQT